MKQSEQASESSLSSLSSSINSLQFQLSSSLANDLIVRYDALARHRSLLVAVRVVRTCVQRQREPNGCQMQESVVIFSKN